MDLAELCSDPENLDYAFDLLNATYGTEVAQAARDRLKNDPDIRPLVQERYWGNWPALPELVALPAGSLGHVYGLNLGAQARPLLAQRWEEGWQTPLDGWRKRLGIYSLLQTTPFPRLHGEAADG